MTGSMTDTRHDGVPVYTVLVPVFNSGATLDELYRRTHAVLTELGENWEMVLVDDGSTDRTWEVLRAIRERDPAVRLVRLKQNCGQMQALLIGVDYCRGSYVIMMDDDLQNPPEEIPRLIAAQQAHAADAVIGRPQRKQHSIARNIGSGVLNFINGIKYSRARGLQTVGSFRLLRREVLQRIRALPWPLQPWSQRILEVTGSIVNVDVVHAPRQYGRSGLSAYALAKLGTRYLFSKSTVAPDRPLENIVQDECP